MSFNRTMMRIPLTRHENNEEECLENENKKMTVVPFESEKRQLRAS